MEHARELGGPSGLLQQKSEVVRRGEPLSFPRCSRFTDLHRQIPHRRKTFPSLSGQKGPGVPTVRIQDRCSCVLRRHITPGNTIKQSKLGDEVQPLATAIFRNTQRAGNVDYSPRLIG